MGICLRPSSRTELQPSLNYGELRLTPSIPISPPSLLRIFLINSYTYLNISKLQDLCTFSEYALVASRSSRLPGDRRRGGRPKNGEPVSLSYRITAGIEHHPKVLADERRILGRFILATNDPELSADELLANYKGQNAV